MKQSDRNDNRHKRRAALLLALVMLLPACGDDDDDDEAGGATEVADSAVDEPATAGGSQTTAAASDQSTTTVAPLSTELGDLPELPVPEDQIDTEATVRFSVAIVEQQLDPHKVTQSFNDHIFYDSVFQLDKDLNVMPGIGTGFTLSDDQKSIDVTIRDDATFADGTAVDAAAVKASLDRARTLPESVVKGRLAGITEITVVDPQTLRLELSEPDATLIFVLATNAGMVINPKALTDGTDLGTATAGSTPYDLAEYVPGQKFVAVRRDGFDYWDPAAWKIKRIEFHQVTDQTAAVNGLQTDVFDSIRLTLPTDAAQQQIGPAFNYVLPPANSMRALMLRDTQPALQDPTIRQAIAHAIDDEAIATSVLNRCDFSGGQLVRAGDPAYIEGYEAFPYDPDKARELLAGRTPSFELLVASTQPEENNWAQVAQQQLADVGISTTITPFSLADATAQFQGKSRDAYFQGSTGQADLALTVSFFFFGPNALAGTPELQDALRQGIATANALPLGSPERAEALQELHRVALESAVYIPACHLSQYYASDKNLVGMDDTEFGYSGSFSVRYLVWTK